MKKYPNTNYHPSNKGIRISYEVEWTEKNEQIKDDFSNLKKIKCNDLKEMITAIIKLKLTNKYNISAYLIVNDIIKNQWLLEDSTGNYIENIKLNTDYERENRLKESLHYAEEEINEYKEFLKQYNAEKLFKEWQEKGKNKTA